MAERRHLLILGGTGEAVALAARAAATARLRVTTSLAGRTSAPARPEGERRSGGFGGAAGLARYLREAGIDLVIDATHPYAARISRHATEACAAAGIPRLALLRPPWTAQPGDRWIEVADAAEAAAALGDLGRRVFLTTGRQTLEAFAALAEHWFLVRLIETPRDGLPLQRYEAIAARGPVRVNEEIALLRRHGIEAVVSKNSGGDATHAKIAAARACALPVVMIRRPAPPAGERAESIEAALAWLGRHLA
jgi:precorrin-6A/cobalt-precorrin-6A reductase